MQGSAWRCQAEEGGKEADMIKLLLLECNICAVISPASTGMMLWGNLCVQTKGQCKKGLLVASQQPVGRVPKSVHGLAQQSLSCFRLRCLPAGLYILYAAECGVSTCNMLQADSDIAWSSILEH